MAQDATSQLGRPYSEGTLSALVEWHFIVDDRRGPTHTRVAVSRVALNEMIYGSARFCLTRLFSFFFLAVVFAVVFGVWRSWSPDAKYRRKANKKKRKDVRNSRKDRRFRQEPLACRVRICRWSWAIAIAAGCACGVNVEAARVQAVRVSLRGELTAATFLFIFSRNDGQ